MKKTINTLLIATLFFTSWRSLFFFFFFLLFINTAFAQTETNEIKHALRTSNTLFGLSTIGITDNYLSPLPYSGSGLKFAIENGRLLNPNNENLSIRNRTEIMLGTLINPPGTAGMLYLGANYAWGMHYHFRPAENLQILAGGFWDIDFGAKYIARNVNNPVNLDLATNWNASAIVIYDIPTPKRIVRLRASFETPLIGCMFAPEQGSSYYEIFSLGAPGQFVHFSSLYNKLALRQTYSVEIPLRNSFWRFGFAGNSLKYSTNDMIFKKNDYTLFFGYTRVFSRFTRKNPAPENFVGY